jgi:Phage terminase-like protein, large subunit
MKSYIEQYYNEIDSGRIKANVWIKGIYKQLINIIDGNDENYTLDIKKGHKPIEFMEKFCRQTKGEWAGKPMDLMLFQKAKLEATFGIVHQDTGLRRFRQVFDLRARKNGKTTENAGTALYLLGMDKEGGAEVYSAATVRSQAALSFTEAANMINRSSDLQEIYRAVNTEIKCELLGGFYKALGKNTSNFDGLNAHGVILDEVHALDRDIYDILKQSTSARRQWLINMITTAGTMRAGLFDDLYKSMMSLALGEAKNDTFLPILYQLDEGDDFRDEDVWIKANPGIDFIKSRSELRSNVQQIGIDPAFEATVKVKDFNILGIRRLGWLKYSEYNNDKTFDLKEFKNKLVIIGVDLSKTTDMTAVNFTAWDRKSKQWITHQMYWITEEFYQANKDGEIPYRLWVDQGYVRISGKHNIVYSDVSNYILTFNGKTGCRVGWIYYDSYSAVYFIEELKKMGFHDCVPTIQGYKTLSVPMQTLGTEIKSHYVNYQNNPVTKWCLSNTEIDMDCNGNIKPKKYEDKRNLKIEGTAVLLNSFVGITDHMDNMKNYA